MAGNLKSCFFLSICWMFFLQGIAMADENKIENNGAGTDKTQFEKRLVVPPGTIIQLSQDEFNRMTAASNPGKDSSDAKNDSQPGTDNNLKKDGPDTKKEITGSNGTCLNFLMDKLNMPWTDEKYSMRIISPNPNIDPGISVNITKPGTEYSMIIINPFTKKKTTGYTESSFGICPHKFQMKDK